MTDPAPIRLTSVELDGVWVLMESDSSRETCVDCNSETFVGLHKTAGKPPIGLVCHDDTCPLAAAIMPGGEPTVWVEDGVATLMHALRSHMADPQETPDQLEEEERAK